MQRGHLQHDPLIGLCTWTVLGGPVFLSSSLFPSPHVKIKDLGALTGKKCHLANIYLSSTLFVAGLDFGWVESKTPIVPALVLLGAGRGTSPVSK